MLDSTKVHEHRPTLFANNWDRFGGRALDILNCFYVAQKLQINFKFFWPYNSFFSQDDPHFHFFSQEFRDMYRVERDLDPGAKQLIDFSEYTFAAAKDLIESVDSNAFIGIANFFALPRFSDESEEECAHEYSICAQSVMSLEVRETFEEIKNFGSDWITIHGRYGDLIDGGFKQYVPQSKYVNTINYRNFIEKRSSKKIVFLSDSPSVVEGLSQLTKRDLTFQYRSLKLHDLFGVDSRDFLDLLVMANSEHIVAPQLSAYSILASRLGGTNLFDFNSIAGNRVAFCKSQKYLEEHYASFERGFRDNLKSRDVLNLLQNSYPHLEFIELLDLVKLSYSADNDYVYAACIWSIIQFLLGNSRESALILESIETTARNSLHIHDDPLAIVLVTKFCLSTFKTKQDKESILRELSSLNSFQFSVKLAIGFLDLWTHQLELKEFQKERSIKQIVRAILQQLSRTLIPRKRRINNLWQISRSSVFNELLFSVLDLLLRYKQEDR